MRHLLLLLLCSILVLCCTGSTNANPLNATSNNSTSSPSLRATYNARFQLFVDGCEAPPPLVQAACGGDTIRLISVSHPAIVCSDTPQEELPDGFDSGLTCETDCTSRECQEEVYRNDASYSIMEGPWGEILYQCEGDSRQEIDSVFSYLNNGNATCGWRWFLDNQVYHVAQLGVLCDLDATSPDQVSFLESQTLQGDDNTTTTIYSITDYSFFLYAGRFFECSQGNTMAIDFFDQPYYSPVLCAKGQNCGGNDCEVELDTLQVHVDVDWLSGRCMEYVGGYMSNNNEEEEEEEEKMPKGTYTMEFQVGWTILMKNPHYWYDIHDIGCLQNDDMVLEFRCFDGILEFIEQSDPDQIDCKTIDQSLMECSVPLSGELFHGDEDFLNSFYTVKYVRQEGNLRKNTWGPNIAGAHTSSLPNPHEFTPDLHFFRRTAKNRGYLRRQSNDLH